LRLAAVEQMGEQLAEGGVDRVERRQQPGAALAVQLRDAMAQAGDGGLQIVLFGGELGALGLDLGRVLLGAQVDRAQRLALAAQARDIDLRRLRRGNSLGAKLRQRRRRALRRRLDQPRLRLIRARG